MMRTLIFAFVAAFAFAATEPIALEQKLEQRRLQLLASVWNSTDTSSALSQIEKLRASKPQALLGQKNTSTRWAYWKLHDSLSAGERALTTGVCGKASSTQSFETCLRKAMLGELN